MTNINYQITLDYTDRGRCLELTKITLRSNSASTYYLSELDIAEKLYWIVCAIPPKLRRIASLKQHKERNLAFSQQSQNSTFESFMKQLSQLEVECLNERKKPSIDYTRQIWLNDPIELTNTEEPHRLIDAITLVKRILVCSDKVPVNNFNLESKLLLCVAQKLKVVIRFLKDYNRAMIYRLDVSYEDLEQEQLCIIRTQCDLLVPRFNVN